MTRKEKVTVNLNYTFDDDETDIEIMTYLKEVEMPMKVVGISNWTPSGRQLAWLKLQSNPKNKKRYIITALVIGIVIGFVLGIAILIYEVGVDVQLNLYP